MAARRLIALLLVLLFLSSLAAALIPVQHSGKTLAPATSTTTSSTSVRAAPSPAARSGLVKARVRNSAEPAVVKAHVGDQLQLRVDSRKPGTLELARLGEAEDVGPDDPAYFDVLLDRAGSFPIRYLGSHRQVGRIQVKPARR